MFVSVVQNQTTSVDRFYVIM